MQGILTISRLAVKECITGKTFYGLLVFLILYLLCCVYFSSLSLGTVARLIQNAGLLGLTLIGLLVTILIGLYALYQDKDRNELYVILNRVPSSSYILGRFLGVGLIMIIFSLIMGLGIFVLTWVLSQSITASLAIGVVMSVLEFLLLTGFGILFFAIGLPFFLNTVLSLGVFVLGHAFDEAIQSFVALGRFGSELHLKSIQIMSYLFPNFDLFNYRLAIVHGECIPMEELLLVIGYWIFYMTAVLGLSCWIMGRRDL